MTLVLQDYSIVLETVTVNSTMYRLVHRELVGVEWLLKVGYSGKNEVRDGFLLEAVAGKIVERLGIDYISSIGDVFWINTEGLLEGIPPGDYLASLIKPFKCKSLHEVRKEIDKDVVWDLVHKLVGLGHARGFVHNDLHTGNVLYNLESGELVVIDLGRAYFMQADDLITADELREIYVKVTGEEPEEEIKGLLDYYRLIRPRFGLEEYVRFPRWNSEVGYFCLVMFDVVGLLYYLEYLAVPVELDYCYQQVVKEELSLYSGCCQWLYAYIMVVNKYGSGFDKMVYDNWYLHLPRDENNFIREGFLRRFYRLVKRLRPGYTDPRVRPGYTEARVRAESKPKLEYAIAVQLGLVTKPSPVGKRDVRDNEDASSE
jgi:hypothetical protein